MRCRELLIEQASLMQGAGAADVFEDAALAALRLRAVLRAALPPQDLQRPIEARGRRDWVVCCWLRVFF